MQISGFYLNTIQRNEKNGYATFLLKADNGNILCKGIVPKLRYFVPVTLNGDFCGETFQVESIGKFNDSEQNDISFLAYNMELKDIKISTAKRIMKSIPNGLFSTVETVNSSDEFANMFPGSTQKYAKKIYNRVKTTIAFRNLFEVISSCGGTYSDAEKLVSEYGEKVEQVLAANPYLVGYRFDWKFAMCDALGELYGFGKLSKQRAKYILFYALKSAKEQGNTYMTTSEIKKYIKYSTKNSALGEMPHEYPLAFAVTENSFIVDKSINNINPHIYLRKTYETELQLVKNLSRIIESAKLIPFHKNSIKAIQASENISLSNDQISCFNCVKSEGIKIVTGGPGCGKTTVINCLIKYFEQYYPDYGISLAAPTGCAAQHMSEKSKHLASTAHYLIGLRPFESKKMPDFNSSNMLPNKVYIFDEFSMCDLELAAYIFDAIPNNAIVIIVGDSDQLPSVGAGNVLQDFIDSGLFETYRLNTAFRQASNSTIIKNAKKVINGDHDFEVGQDFEICTGVDEKDTMQKCLDYVKADKKDFQVLCPIKKYQSGAFYMNHKMQEYKHNNTEKCKQYGDTFFYLKDKVITIKNNRKKGYFNGEPGVVTLIDDDGILIKFLTGKEVYIKNALLNEVIPAHAITIHKSQGNEYEEAVILITVPGKSMLDRNILYTAFTRAKKKVTLFVQGDILNDIKEGKKRETDLAMRLISIY